MFFFPHNFYEFYQNFVISIPMKVNKKKKNLIFFVIHPYRYQDAKILTKFREFMWIKEHYQKKLIIAFFSDCYVPNPKVHAKPPIRGN